MAGGGLVAHRIAAQVLHHVRIQTAAPIQGSLCREDMRAYSAQATGRVAAQVGLMCQNMAYKLQPLRASQSQGGLEVEALNQMRMIKTRLHLPQPPLWA